MTITEKQLRDALQWYETFNKGEWKSLDMGLDVQETIQYALQFSLDMQDHPTNNEGLKALTKLHKMALDPQNVTPEYKTRHNKTADECFTVVSQALSKPQDHDTLVIKKSELDELKRTIEFNCDEPDFNADWIIELIKKAGG